VVSKSALSSAKSIGQMHNHKSKKLLLSKLPKIASRWESQDLMVTDGTPDCPEVHHSVRVSALIYFL
jgi:hypothetical protein